MEKTQSLNNQVSPIQVFMFADACVTVKVKIY